MELRETVSELARVLEKDCLEHIFPEGHPGYERELEYNRRSALFAAKLRRLLAECPK